MDYIDQLSREQKTNIDIVIKAFSKWKITNVFTQSAILSVISKESNFKYKFERGYGNTSNDRIRSKFYNRVKHLSDADLEKIKKDDMAFFNLVYAGRRGNGPTDGFKYRGGGPNQLTFKSNYDKIGNHIGVDLVNNPELVNDPYIAADIACSYFVRRFRSFRTKWQDHYNSKSLNGFKTLNEATLAIYHANAGLGKPMYTMEKANASRGGLKKSIVRAPQFLDYLGVQQNDEPFKNKTEGNKFRMWVNDNHYEYAREIDLDKYGSHNNSYILKAYKKYGKEYETNQ